MERSSGGKIGTSPVDNLLAKLFPPPEVFIVSLAAAAEIQRGTVLAREPDGTYTVLGSSTDNDALTGVASCIVAEDTLSTDTTAQAYRTGHFNRRALIVDDDYTLTADDENNLRLAGILLTDRI